MKVVKVENISIFVKGVLRDIKGAENIDIVKTQMPSQARGESLCVAFFIQFIRKYPTLAKNY